MMHQLREKTKVIMLVTAVAFVALMFVEWGMDLSGRSSSEITGGELGRVNGDPITYEEYLPVYRNLYDQQAQEQDEPISTVQDRQIEEEAWNQLVMQKLIHQELRRRGIRVTAAEVRQAARFAPPPEFYENELFQTDGQFDLEKYHRFLSSPSADDQLLLQLEAYYRDMIPRSKLFQQVVSGIYVSDGELWRQWRDFEETVTVRYLAFDPQAMVADADVSVMDREIAAYYDANREEFRRPPRASVRYVVLDKRPTTADTAAARERVEALRQEILAGAAFEEVAERESQDPGSASQGGDLGTFQRGQMVPAFDQVVFSLPIGTVSEPVLTQFGFHVIKVESRDGDEARARHILLPIERSEDSEDALLERADSLEALGEDFPIEEAAQRLGLTVRTAELTKDAPFVPGVGRMDDGAEWALDEAILDEVSPLFEMADAFYMVELVELTPERVIARADATAGIRSRLVAEKKLERARQRVRSIVDELRAGSTLDEVAERHGVEVREAGPFKRLDFVPGMGTANAAIGTAFGLQVGQTSGMVEANGGLYLLQVTDRTEADRAAWEEQKEFLRARVTAGLEQERVNQFLADLRDQARIVDNRDQVLRPSQAEQDARRSMPMPF